MTGSSFAYVSEAYNVVFQSQDKIELRLADDPTDVTVLRRIPE